MSSRGSRPRAIFSRSGEPKRPADRIRVRIAAFLDRRRAGAQSAGIRQRPSPNTGGGRVRVADLDARSLVRDILCGAMAPLSDEPPRPLGFLSRFRRVTASGSFIAEVDGLRFIAIFAVVLFHLAVGLAIKNPARFGRPQDSLLGAMALNGFRGVELFFVISGFILGLPFAAHALQSKPRVDLRAYLLRRLTRLEPPYVLCMVLLFGLQVLVRHRSAAQLLPHLSAGLAYVHNLVYAS